MRFFIALELPEESKQQFQKLQKKLFQILPNATLTYSDKLHLTFAFIGDQQPEIKQSLIEILSKSATGISSFQITPAYIDGFPSIHHPRTIWAGIKGDIDKIIIIRERIKDGLATLHLDTDDRRFVPHITIAKLNNHHEIDLATEEILQEIIKDAFTSIKISSIKLFESVPEGGLHSHNTLAEVRLG